MIVFLHSLQHFFQDLPNVALNKAAEQSSTYRERHASRAVDGDLSTGGGDCAGLEANDDDAWWEVDLQSNYRIKFVKIYKRHDCCNQLVYDLNVTLLDESKLVLDTEEYLFEENPILEFKFENIDGVRYVKVHDNREGTGFSLCEVEVFGY